MGIVMTKGAVLPTGSVAPLVVVTNAKALLPSRVSAVEPLAPDSVAMNQLAVLLAPLIVADVSVGVVWLGSTVEGITNSMLSSAWGAPLFVTVSVTVYE